MSDLVAGMGLVESVDTANAAATVAVDAATSDTEIVFESADIFETDDGVGRLSAAGTLYTYTAVDAETGTVTLGAPLSADLAAGDPVEIYPPAPQTLALVTLDSGDAVTARVAAAHVPLLPEGDRNGQGREFVTLYREGQRYVTLDVPNAKLTIQPQYLPEGGGGTDGGNDDDGFTLPTLSEFVFDGDPDYWVTFDGSGFGRAFTEDEAYAAFADVYFIEDVEASAGTITVPLVQIPSWVFDTGATILYPAWVVPLVGQDSKFTVDSAMAYGMHNDDDPDDPWNGGVESFLFFGSILDDPWAGRTWSQEDKYEMSVINNDGTGGVDEYFIRTWSPPGGDEPLPASSTTETYADANKRALLVVLPIYISTSVAVYTAGSTYTGVRMEQA